MYPFQQCRVHRSQTLGMSGHVIGQKLKKGTDDGIVPILLAFGT